MLVACEESARALVRAAQEQSKLHVIHDREAQCLVTAALPIGANVFMFSQRYGVAEELITASVAVSTVLAVVTVSVVMLLVGRL